MSVKDGAQDSVDASKNCARMNSVDDDPGKEVSTPELSRQLEESLAEEARLQELLEGRRSLKRVQQSQITSLNMRTDGLMQRLAKALPSLSSYSAVGVNSLMVRSATSGVPSTSDPDALEEELSLEGATAQLGCVEELRKQVQCLEEELELRNSEVEKLEGELRAYTDATITGTKCTER